MEMRVLGSLVCISIILIYCMYSWVWEGWVDPLHIWFNVCHNN